MIEQVAGGAGEGSEGGVAASVADTRAELLGRSKRSFAPIESSFVQNPNRSVKDRQGPLAMFVRNGDLRGLHALLLLHAVISSGDSEQGWSTTLPLGAWARAFGITATAEGTAASTGASKVIKRLVDRQLVAKEPAPKREVRLTLLRPDGSGTEYERPLGGVGQKYLKLPHLFWTEGWCDQLDLAATAMLLVALHEKPVFELPTEHMERWYGFSPDTAERGFKTLKDIGVLAWEQRAKKAPLSKTGLTKVNVYALGRPFRGNQLPHEVLFKALAKGGAGQ